MKKNIDSNFAIAILALVAACVGFAFYFLGISDDLETENISAQPPTRALIDLEGIPSENMDGLMEDGDDHDLALEVDKGDQLVREFVSDNLGVQFRYANYPGEVFEIEFVENGTAIQLGKEFDPNRRSDIEVFTFDPTLSYLDGIAALFLADSQYDEECFVEEISTITSENHPTGHRQAIITHPMRKVAVNLDDPRGNCSEQFSEAGYYAVFLFNDDVPGKVAYVIGGQDAVASDGEGNPWINSIEIFK